MNNIGMFYNEKTIIDINS